MLLARPDAQRAVEVATALALLLLIIGSAGARFL